MGTFLENIKRIRSEYSNRNVREDMAQALEKLKSWITSVKISAGSDNLLPYPAGTYTHNGITYEMTDEGIHIYGTATAQSLFALDWHETNLQIGKKYIAKLTNSPVTGVFLIIGYYMSDDAFVKLATVSTKTTVTIPSQYVSSRNMITVNTGTTVDVVVTPSIRLANEEDDTQPEVYTVEEISEKIHSGSIGGGKGFKVVTLASQMTDSDMLYVYMGSETGYQNGYWYYHNGTTWAAGAQFYLGQDGQDGEDGADGLTPYIGQNGDWFIGITDTEVVARASTEDTEARDSIADLQTTVAALQLAIAGITSEWETVLDKTMYGIHWVISINQFTHEFFIDAGGTWSGSPSTSGTEFQVTDSAISALAYEDTLNDYVMYAAYSNNQQGRVHVKPDGTVWFGWCVNIASGSQLKASGNCRIKMVGVMR